MDRPGGRGAALACSPTTRPEGNHGGITSLFREMIADCYPLSLVHIGRAAALAGAAFASQAQRLLRSHTLVSRCAPRRICDATPRSPLHRVTADPTAVP